MTEREAFIMLLEQSGGDPYKALRIAVRWAATNGLLISAGFVRCSPYSEVAEPEQKPEPLDA